MRGLCIAGILLLLSGAVAGTSYVQANGQTIAKINESGVFYYHHDHLGSTSAITNSDGDIVEEQVNLPFGELISGNERYGFTGKELDFSIGLMYYGARYYLPEIGRFITSDAAMDGMNWYIYAKGNPLTFLDPTGREATPAHDKGYDVTYNDLEGKYQHYRDLKYGSNTAAILSMVTMLEKHKRTVISEVVSEKFLADKASNIPDESFSAERDGDKIKIEFDESCKYTKDAVPFVGRIPLLGRLIPSATVEFPKEVEISMVREDGNLHIGHLLNGGIEVKVNWALKKLNLVCEGKLKYIGIFTDDVGKKYFLASIDNGASFESWLYSSFEITDELHTVYDQFHEIVENEIRAETQKSTPQGL